MTSARTQHPNEHVARLRAGRTWRVVIGLVALSLLTQVGCGWLGLGRKAGKSAAGKSKARAVPIRFLGLGLRPGTGFKGLRIDYKISGPAPARVRIDVAAFNISGDAVRDALGGSGRWILTPARNLSPGSRDSVTWERLWRVSASCIVLNAVELRYKNGTTVRLRTIDELRKVTDGHSGVCMRNFYVAQALRRQVHGRYKAPRRTASIQKYSASTSASRARQTVRLAGFTVTRCSLGRRFLKKSCRGFARYEQWAEAQAVCAKLRPKGSWRVPSLKELRLISKAARQSSRFNEHGHHWTTSLYPYHSDAAAIVLVPRGRTHYERKVKAARVLCVR